MSLKSFYMANSYVSDDDRSFLISKTFLTWSTKYNVKKQYEGYNIIILVAFFKGSFEDVVDE